MWSLAGILCIKCKIKFFQLAYSGHTMKWRWPRIIIMKIDNSNFEAIRERRVKECKLLPPALMSIIANIRWQIIESSIDISDFISSLSAKRNHYVLYKHGRTSFQDFSQLLEIKASSHFTKQLKDFACRGPWTIISTHDAPTLGKLFYYSINL